MPVGDIDLLVDDSQFAAINGIPSGRFSVIQDTSHSLAVSFAALLPGDYDGNDIVDSADYNLWRPTFGSTTDRNRNGVVDAGDYVLWRIKQSIPAAGASGPVNSAAVPEPTSLVLLIFAVAGWFLRRTRTA